MCSFGESVSVTPLQLGALVSAIANGGTLYYLQHPQAPEDIATFKPRIKRMLGAPSGNRKVTRRAKAADGGDS